MDGATWNPAEFADPTHLNPGGNLRVAQMLKEGVPWSRLTAGEALNPK
jgi:lysophospholipase L1-like esterase